MNRRNTEFLDHCWLMIDFWESTADRTTCRERLEGITHSLLATLDGVSADAGPPDPDDHSEVLHERLYRRPWPSNTAKVEREPV